MGLPMLLQVLTRLVERVNRVQNFSKKKGNSKEVVSQGGNAFNNNKFCDRCGGNHHEQTCKYTNEQCHWCKKTGHIIRMCRVNQRSQGKNKVAHVSEGDEPTVDQTLGLFGVYSADADINGVSGCKGIEVNVNLGKLNSTYAIGDWGCILHYPRNYIQKDPSKYPLQTSSITLKSYTGDLIPVAGKLKFQSHIESSTSHRQLLLHAVSDQHCSGEIVYTRSSWTGRALSV